jgi:predicted metal-dependent enzyme (double-stranded beta helix superfamily)
MAGEAGAIFQRFIVDVRATWASDSDMGRRMEKTRPLLERLVADPQLRAASQDWPSTEGHKNLLLHIDPEYGFVVNAVVRAPRRTGSVHDHAQAWVLYGVLDGTESLERYDRLDDGSKPGYAEVKLTGVTTGGPGKVDLVPPYAIHAEQGGPTRSVAVILRSERLVGRLLQHGYDPQTNKVIERSGPTQIPFELGVEQMARCRPDGRFVRTVRMSAN